METDQKARVFLEEHKIKVMLFVFFPYHFVLYICEEQNILYVSFSKPQTIMDLQTIYGVSKDLNLI